MDKVVIIGGGGHAKVIIDIIQSVGKYEIVGFTARSYSDSSLCGVPYLGDDSILSSLQRSGVNFFSAAIGNNQLRKKLFDEYTQLGLTPINAISPFAYISTHAHIGKGIVIMPGAVINANASIGDNAIINTRSGIDHDCVVGSHTHIAPGVSLAGGVKVGEGALIGVGSNVIPDIHIGDWSVIGAGSTVISHIKSNVTVVGVPANKYLKRDEVL